MLLVEMNQQGLGITQLRCVAKEAKLPGQDSLQIDEMWRGIGIPMEPIHLAGDNSGSSDVI
ncbi:hypothetical protein OUZ56_012730 [Daphnia magna]|uniref:Uncharacterized protein n=1 Tax=Daphnia magna TaxID=35525 RepID=A0ABQ9Z3V5_9CRUS|nr:hypothetical protein OUZ56_012730 [Daphnia magna]